MRYQNFPCRLCGRSDQLDFIGAVSRRPEKETDLGIKPEDYYREVFFCRHCGVYNNFHRYDFSQLYQGNYNQATYAKKISKNYQKIMALPPELSDNKQRVKRIVSFLTAAGRTINGLKVLDVGSGLGVFLGECLKYGFATYSLDPDPASASHTRQEVKVNQAFQGLFEDFSSSLEFSLITFNKVLEHTINPIVLLAKARDFLSNDGLVYLELPDREESVKDGGILGRGEFSLEHYFVFTPRSLDFLASRAGFQVIVKSQIHEPSEKYTLYAFLKPVAKKVADNQK